MVYGYIRESIREQLLNKNSLTIEKQALIDAGSQYVFIDKISDKQRSELEHLLTVLSSGDKLVISKLWKIANTTEQAITLIEDLISKGIIVEILNIGILDESINGKKTRHLLSVFSDNEKEAFQERTSAGKKDAKQDPKFREGRPSKYNEEEINDALELLKEHSFSQVEKLTGISKSTLNRYKKRTNT